MLSDLLARATREEQDFLVRLIYGELRQGALAGLMAEALAAAAEVPADEVRRALMLAGELPEVARAVLTEGRSGLARFRLELFRPLQPMLAQPAGDVSEALERLGEAAFELKLDVPRLRGELPLTPFFFDLLHLDGSDLIDRPAGERFSALGEAVPGLAVPRLVTADAEEADAFFEDALARGHEGIMAKAVDAPYEAGRRGFSWLKVKPAHTLDLVILAAEWGHGRRQGWLSNLHLAPAIPKTAAS